MTEEERQALLVDAINYWFPIRWESGGSTYERLTYAVFGDVDSGGVRITASKDGAASVDIDFANEDCYGTGKLDVTGALTQFFAGFGS